MNIQDYLRFINNKYLYSSRKAQILFVEGYSDKRFYLDAFMGDRLLALNENNICYYFAKDGDRYSERWVSYFGDSYRKQQAVAIVDGLRGVYRYNYEFVIAATHDDNQPKENCKINSFGFIDKDFGGKHDVDNSNLSFYSPRHLAQTQYHDRETSLIFNYLPKIYNALKAEKGSTDNDRFIAILSSILYFSTCQGILEENSVSMNSFNLSRKDSKDLKVLTNYAFKDQWESLKSRYGDVETFDFLKYLADAKRAYSSEWVRRFIDKCEREIKALKKAMLMSSVVNWLDSAHTTNLLEKVFNFSNGHTVWDNIAERLFWYFGFDRGDATRRLESLIARIIRAEDPRTSAVRTTSPIKEYIAYKNDI